MTAVGTALGGLHATTALILDQIDAMRRKVDQLYGDFESRQRAVGKLQTLVTAYEQQVALLALTEKALTTLLADVSAESLRTMEGIVTYGVRTVFEDRLLSFKFVATQVRGVPSVEPVLMEGATEAPILDAFGGGPASVVAFLLRLLVVHRLGLYPLLLLDESFAMVSAEYIPNLAALLKELAAKLGFTFLLVTHPQEILDYVDRAYRVQDLPGGGISFLEVR